VFNINTFVINLNHLSLGHIFISLEMEKNAFILQKIVLKGCIYFNY